MRATRLLTVVFVGVVAGSCATTPTEPEIPLALRLQFGASAALPSGQTVTFEAVPEDSRCPVDVACIWPGNARVVVRVSPAFGSADARSLNTGVEPRQAVIDGLLFRIASLAPDPHSERPIDPADYVVVLQVSRGS